MRALGCWGEGWADPGCAHNSREPKGRGVQTMGIVETHLTGRVRLYTQAEACRYME